MQGLNVDVDVCAIKMLMSPLPLCPGRVELVDLLCSALDTEKGYNCYKIALTEFIKRGDKEANTCVGKFSDALEIYTAKFRDRISELE